MYIYIYREIYIYGYVQMNVHAQHIRGVAFNAKLSVARHDEIYSRN